MFFAFRSCEYLKVSQAEQLQMEQLCMRNICFFKERKIIPHTHPHLEFVDCVSITFEHQKQENKHNTITQESSVDLVLCPVRFAAGLVQRIWSYKGTDSNTQVSAYICNGLVKHVASAQVINALQDMVGGIGETRLGIDKHKIGTNLIRSGAAMAMYLLECLVYTIMIIGHWSSNAFLRYIQKQIMEFSHKVSKKMLCFKNCKHVPNYDHRIAANNPRVCNDPNNAKTRRNIGGDASRQSRLPAFTQFN
jgi:hypothetical protein